MMTYYKQVAFPISPNGESHLLPDEPKEPKKFNRLLNHWKGMELITPKTEIKSSVLPENRRGGNKNPSPPKTDHKKRPPIPSMLLSSGTSESPKTKHSVEPPSHMGIPMNGIKEKGSKAATVELQQNPVPPASMTGKELLRIRKDWYDITAIFLKDDFKKFEDMISLAGIPPGAHVSPLAHSQLKVEELIQELLSRVEAVTVALRNNYLMLQKPLLPGTEFHKNISKLKNNFSPDKLRKISFRQVEVYEDRKPEEKSGRKSGETETASKGFSYIPPGALPLRGPAPQESKPSDSSNRLLHKQDQGERSRKSEISSMLWPGNQFIEDEIADFLRRYEKILGDCFQEIARKSRLSDESGYILKAGICDKSLRIRLQKTYGEWLNKINKPLKHAHTVPLTYNETTCQTTMTLETMGELSVSPQRWSDKPINFVRQSVKVTPLLPGGESHTYGFYTLGAFNTPFITTEYLRSLWPEELYGVFAKHRQVFPKLTKLTDLALFLKWFYTLGKKEYELWLTQLAELENKAVTKERLVSALTQVARDVFISSPGDFAGPFTTPVILPVHLHRLLATAGISMERTILLEEQQAIDEVDTKITFHINNPVTGTVVPVIFDIALTNVGINKFSTSMPTMLNGVNLQYTVNGNGINKLRQWAIKKLSDLEQSVLAGNVQQETAAFTAYCLTTLYLDISHAHKNKLTDSDEHLGQLNSKMLLFGLLCNIITLFGCKSAKDRKFLVLLCLILGMIMMESYRSSARGKEELNPKVVQTFIAACRSRLEQNGSNGTPAPKLKEELSEHFFKRLLNMPPIPKIFEFIPSQESSELMLEALLHSGNFELFRFAQRYPGINITSIVDTFFKNFIKDRSMKTIHRHQHQLYGTDTESDIAPKSMEQLLKQLLEGFAKSDYRGKDLVPASNFNF